MPVSLVLSGGPGDGRTVELPDGPPPATIDFVTKSRTMVYGSPVRRGLDGYTYTPVRLIDRIVPAEEAKKAPARKATPRKRAPKKATSDNG